MREISILEALARIEHEQWMSWSMSLALDSDEKISIERIERWNALWVPYDKLPEEEKEKDRFWAREALSAMHRESVTPKRCYPLMTLRTDVAELFDVIPRYHPMMTSKDDFERYMMFWYTLKELKEYGRQKLL